MGSKYKISVLDNPGAIQSIMSPDGLIDKMGGIDEVGKLTNKLINMEVGGEFIFDKRYSRVVVRAFLLFKGFNIINSKKRSLFTTILLGDGRVKIRRKAVVKDSLSDSSIEKALSKSLGK